MKKNSLLELCATLSEEEWQAFKDFLQLKQHRKKKQEVRLLKIIAQHYPNLEDIEEVIKDAFNLANGSNSKRSYPVTKSRLHKLLEKFLIQERLNRSEALQDYLLAEELEERGQEERFFNWIRDQKKKSSQDHWGLYLNYRYAYLDSFNSFEESRKEEGKNLHQIVKQLDRHWAISRLVCMCEIKTVSKAVDTEDIHTDWILDFFKEHFEALSPFEQMYYWAYHLITKRQQAAYEALRVLYRKHYEHPSLPFKEGALIFNYLTNYCIYKTRESSLDQSNSYHKTLFDWYIWGIEKGILNTQFNTITTHFLNIAASVQTEHDILSIASWLKENDAYLEQRLSNNVYFLGKAFMASVQEGYELAEEYIKLEGYPKPEIRVRLEAIRLIVLFYRAELSLKDEDTFKKKCRNFKNYLGKNKDKNERIEELYLRLKNFAIMLENIYHADESVLTRLLGEIEDGSNSLAYQALLHEEIVKKRDMFI